MRGFPGLIVAVALVVSACSSGASSPSSAAATQAASSPSAVSSAGPALAPPAILQAGVLQLAADFSAAPNQYIENGQMKGLNPDLCSEIGKRLGLQVQWTNLAFDGLIPGLQARRFDALCTSVFVTAAREQVMNMIPYVQWGDTMGIPAANSHKISCPNNDYNTCYTQLSGLTVATTKGGSEEKQLQAANQTLQQAGKNQMNLLAFDTNTQAYQAILNGQADAVFVNDPQFHFFASQHPGQYVTVFTAFGATALSLTTLKDNAALANALVQALQAMKADGTYTTILTKWGVQAVDSFAMNPPAK